VELLVLRPAAVTGLLFLLACGGESAEGGDRATAPLEPTTRDSSGVTIHEHPADALERAPLITMDSVPLTVIGDDTEANDVSRMFGLTFLADGSVAGFDNGLGSVRFFDAGGIQVASHGRSGQGPEEFGQFGVTIAVTPGDTLVVSDASNSRFALVTRDNGVVRLRPSTLRHDNEMHGVVGRFVDGAWVLAPSNMLQARSASEVQPPRRSPMAIGRILEATPADQFDTLLVSLGSETARYKSSFGPREDLVDGVPAFGARTLVTEWGGHAAVLTNESWEVARYAADGALAHVVRIQGPRRAVNDSVVAVWREGSLELARQRAAEDPERGAMMIEQTTSYLDNTARADSIPPFMSVFRTPGQLLWLMEYPVVQSDSLRFTAVHADGRIVGRLTLAPLTRALAFADDRIAVRTEDEDGVARVAVHQLRVPR
jgi:hypothetical protein